MDIIVFSNKIVQSAWKSSEKEHFEVKAAIDLFYKFLSLAYSPSIFKTVDELAVTECQLQISKWVTKVDVEKPKSGEDEFSQSTDGSQLVD